MYAGLPGENLGDVLKPGLVTAWPGDEGEYEGDVGEYPGDVDGLCGLNGFIGLVGE